jgi:hypothetical protein
VYIKIKKNCQPWEKAHKYGINVFKIHIDRDLIWYLSLYAGKTAGTGASVPTNMILKFSRILLGCGRAVVTRNYYTSVELVR